MKKTLFFILAIISIALLRTVEVKAGVLITGDVIEDPIWITGTSFTDSGNTSLFENDYEIGIEWPYFQESKDVVYAFTLTEYKTVSVSLENSSFTTQLGIYEEGVVPSFFNHLYYNDYYNWGSSAIMNVQMGPGTYYIIIDALWGASGDYEISVNVDDYTQPLHDEDFEGGVLPSGWLVIDANNDEKTWYAGQITFGTDPAYSGEWFMRAMVNNYNGTGDMDDWLVTPRLLPSAGNSMIEFYLRGTSAYWTEEYEVRLSTTGTEIADFDVLIGSGAIINNDNWQLFSYDLSAYNGQEVYVAIVCLSIDEFGFSFDVDAFSGPIVYPEVDLALVSFQPDYAPAIGIDNNYKVKVKNWGNTTSNYNLVLYNGNNDVLYTLAGYEIPHNQVGSYTLTWNPGELGEEEIYARVEITGDENPDDNESEHAIVNVMPENTIRNNLGMENITFGSEPTKMPIVTFYPNSVSESFFPASDFNATGLINAVSYYYNFTEDDIDVPLVIRVGETTENNLANGVILAGELTTVFDGTVTFNSEVNEIVIPFDYAYYYQGGNLVVMVEHSMSDHLGFQNKFILSSDHNGEIRTWTMASEVIPIDPNQNYEAYVSYTEYPSTSLFINNSPAGSVDGLVTDEQTDPIDGADLYLISDIFSLSASTGADGAYGFGYVPEGTYDLLAIAPGFSDYLMEDIIIVQGVNTTIDITMIGLAQVSVTGYIYGEDEPTIGIADAVVSLEGYENHEATTNSNGFYQFDNVYGGALTYEMSVIANRYETFTQDVVVDQSNLTVDDIILSELFLPVSGLTAEVNATATAVDVIWNQANTGVEHQFRTDDGIMVYNLGYSTANDHSILGTVYRNQAQLNELSWFLDGEYTVHPEVKLVILGLDETGIPDENNIIFESDMIPNIDDEWNIYTLSTPIIVSGGFYFGVMTPGIHTSIGLDDGVGEPWVFENQTHYVCWDWVNSPDWVALEDVGSGFINNILVRVNGIDMGEVSFGDKSYSNTGNVGNLPERQSVTPIETSKPAFSSIIPMFGGKSVTGYNIYRLIDGDQFIQGNWTELSLNIADTTYTDNDWPTLPAEVYRYAVNSIFADGESEFAFSNIVAKDLTAEVTINVTTMGGEPTEGAEVMMYNDDYSHTGSVSATGTIVFDNVWIDQSYLLIVKLGGFITHTEYDVYISGTTTLDVVLVDLLVRPGDITAELTGNAGDVEVTWSVPDPGIDEMRHDDGVMEGGIQLTASPFNLLGSVFLNDAYVTSVSWMILPSQPHPFVKIVIIQLDENGMPDQAKVMHESEMVPNVDYEWSSYDLPEPLNASTGFYVGISTPDQTLAMAYDDGIGSPYIFENNTHMGCEDWTNGLNEWLTLEDAGFANNLFVRAYGVDYEELGKSTKSVANNWVNHLFTDFQNFHNIVASQPDFLMPKNTKALDSYKVYRLFPEDEPNPGLWTLVGESITSTSFVDNTIEVTGTYEYAVKAVYSGGQESGAGFSNTVYVVIVGTNDNILKSSANLQSFPNPFNLETNIRFTLDEDQLVTLQIFDMGGTLIKTLANDNFEQGEHTILWDAVGQSGEKVSTGVYFCKMISEKQTSSIKLIVR